MIKKFIYIMIFLLFSCKIQDGISWHLTDQINPKDFFITIKTETYLESNYVYEIDLIYLFSDSLHLHSVINSSIPEFEKDTVVTLSGEQVMVMDEYLFKIRNKVLCNKDSVFAGSFMTYNIQFGDKVFRHRDRCIIGLLESVVGNR